MKRLKNFNYLNWQCRRGMLELDEILLIFLTNDYINLSYDLKLKFNKLLEASDADLFDWLLSKSIPSDLELIDIVMIIKNRLIK